ncbi:hypothetical protein [Prochlorococcus marinus]|nr:hypothetical protein [Prochlorococcus marinus]
MILKNDSEANSNYLRELDEAQNQRLEQMFEELKKCKIERLSEIDPKPS